jgi:hypothetical protein
MSVTTAWLAQDTQKSLWVTIRNDCFGNIRSSMRQLMTCDGKTCHPNKRRVKLAPSRSKLTDGKSPLRNARLRMDPPQAPQVGGCDVKNKNKCTIVLASNKRMNSSRTVGHRDILTQECSSDPICVHR